MIPTIVVERRLKKEIAIQDDTEIPQMKMTREGNTGVEGGTLHHPHHLLSTERKNTATDIHPRNHHLKRESRRRDIGIHRRAAKGEEGMTRGMDAQSIAEMTKRTSIDHIDIIGMTHRIRVQVLQ